MIASLSLPHSLFNQMPHIITYPLNLFFAPCCCRRCFSTHTWFWFHIVWSIDWDLNIIFCLFSRIFLFILSIHFSIYILKKTIDISWYFSLFMVSFPCFLWKLFRFCYYYFSISLYFSPHCYKTSAPYERGPNACCMFMTHFNHYNKLHSDNFSKNCNYWSIVEHTLFVLVDIDGFDN